MEVKKNITSIFMVPTLRVPKDALRSNGFINGYIKDEKMQHGYEDPIYLLFKPDNLDKFREFLDGEYERTKSIIEIMIMKMDLLLLYISSMKDSSKIMNLLNRGNILKHQKHSRVNSLSLSRLLNQD